MISLGAVLAVVALGASAHEGDAGRLPVCGNRVINLVVRRSGCTVGDARCWSRSGGFCTDYVERRLRAQGRSGDLAQMRSVGLVEVRKGDVAVFVSRAHYAFVEGVLKDKDGRPFAVNLSEYNFGTCWVDRDVLVTDQYKVVNRRSRVPLRDVDGGFLRPVPASRSVRGGG